MKKMAPLHRFPRACCGDREGFLLEVSAKKKVLHIACAAWPATEAWCEDGSLLHLRLGAVAESLVGFDLSAEGLSILARHGVGDLDQVDLLDHEAVARAWSRLGFEPEVVVIGEILEHLGDPGLLLRNIAAHLPEECRVVVTAPSALSFRGILHAICGYEKVAPDHVAYYSPATLDELLSRSGFVVEDMRWYRRSGPLRGLERVLRWAVAPLLALQPQWSEGVVATCRLRGSATREAAAGASA